MLKSFNRGLPKNIILSLDVYKFCNKYVGSCKENTIPESYLKANKDLAMSGVNLPPLQLLKQEKGMCSLGAWNEKLVN